MEEDHKERWDVAINIRIAESMFRQMQRYSRRTDLPMAAIAREALRRYLAELEERLGDTG